jgi:hypothetical protein
MRHRPVSRCLLSAPFALVLVLPGCSSGSGGGSGDGFQLTRISLLDGAVWKVNQEIVFTFSDEVDFSSVSSNTISIQTTSGTPATGTYFSRGTNQVVFQPTCPSSDDPAATGLVPDGVRYSIRVLGRSSGAVNTVRSSTGAPLEVTQVRTFTTDDVGEEFLDTQQGPPVPVVRSVGSNEQDATYLEVGGDPDNRVYFERDASQNLVLSVPGFASPLNLYSDPASTIAVVIEFNQAVHPASSNVSSSRMRLEFLDGGTWRPLETEVTLVANCTEVGARVRLEPLGILPRETQIRAVVLVGLEDLVRDPTTAVNDGFAVAPTQTVDFSSLNPADSMSDEFAEEFDFGGTSALSFQDVEALSASPRAVWGNGRLAAAFDFGGDGGPGGDFDWLVLDGDEILVDTDDGAILEEDGVRLQLIDDGIVDVRNMTIEAGGVVRVQGSHPLRIHATGTVIIRGLLDVSGFDAENVTELNTGNDREEGGHGGPGGGRGGHSNEVVTNSTSQGGTGQGPPGTTHAGGGGGESGFAPASLTQGKDARRPGGGAGGRFADLAGAENGANGSNLASGALPPNPKPPRGGLRANGPFADGDSSNDFFGTMAVGTPSAVTGLIRGELSSLWGGYGGGGGGNANPASQFPTPNWTPASDEKGGAGGGGGGGLSIRALGPIQFGATGLIRCNGGSGATGENVLVQDHVGGSGGSGSGGHVLLETAAFIDFTDGGAASQVLVRDWITALGGPKVTGPPTTGGNVSFGGAGGPGVIQLHVPDSLTGPDTDPAFSDIVVPFDAMSTGDPIDAVVSPEASVLIPSFGAHSQARSEWVSIGRADQTPTGIPASLQFLFEGIDPTLGANEGKILVSDEDGDGDADDVTPLAALLDENLEGNPDVSVLPDRLTLRIEGTSLGVFSGANDLYLRNPSLLEEFVLRLSVAAESKKFVVAVGDYDEGTAGPGDEFLDLTVEDADGDLQDFIDANTALGTIRYELIPRFFRVVTGGVEDALPATSFVRILFQGAADDGTGSPNEAAPLVDWTGDISQFNGLAPGELQFFRFDVQFDLGAQISADTQAVTLDFLRIPFVF